MPYYFAVYGYEITQRAEFGLFVLEPIVSRFRDANELALDKKKFNLTAVGEIKNGPNPEALFDLAGALTFCQQQWVVVGKAYEFPERTEIGESKSKFPAIYETTNTRPTHGALIISDAFENDARKNFLKLCIEKLTDEAFEERTNFRKAYFRNVESWRMSRQITDVTYYLDFSTLEILSRTILRDYHSNIAGLASRLLNQYGFAVTQDNVHERHLGMQTYAHLRNALFHNGEFKKTFQENHTDVTLKLNDYADYLRCLIPDLLLKILGYNDNRINWNRWLDRMPFN